jgi:hypothetical protein
VATEASVVTAVIAAMVVTMVRLESPGQDLPEPQERQDCRAHLAVQPVEPARRGRLEQPERPEQPGLA